MNNTPQETVEVITRWERKEDGVVDIEYSYDGGETWVKKDEANTL